MILLIYNEKICKEILLPNVYDVDWNIEMDRAFYGLNADVTLNLENRMGDWYLKSNSRYFIVGDVEQVAERLFVDGKVTEIRTDSGERIFIVASANETCLNVMSKYDLRSVDTITVGAREDNTVCYRFQNLISASHLTIRRNGGGWVVIDSSSNGIFRENRRINGVNSLAFGDHINVFGLHIIFFEPFILIGANCGELVVSGSLIKMELPDYGEAKITRKEHVVQHFNRAPRAQTVLYKEKVEIEAPPQPKQTRQKPALLVIGPAFSMAIPMMLGFLVMAWARSRSSSGMGNYGSFMYMGLIIAIGAATVGAVWAVLNMKYDKQQRIADEEQRFNAYSNYLVNIVESLRGYYRHNSEAIARRYPSAAESLGYNRYSPELWNRNTGHEDFLFQRLGLGTQDFQVDIEIPKEKFTLISDSLQDRPHQIKEEFSRLINVPVGINLLEHKLIGIVGGDSRNDANIIMHILTAGIASSHSYTDVKLVYLFDEASKSDLENWECIKWLPHVWSEDRQTRFMAGNDLERNEILFTLANVIRTRAEQNESGFGKKKQIPKPYYVMFVSNPVLLQGELLTRYIYDKDRDYGITTVLMAESRQQLPNICDIVIENDRYFRGIIDLASEEQDREQPIKFDIVDRNALSAFGKTLANISVKEVEINSEIPDRLGFLEMYDVGTPEELDVAERWRKNRTYNSMRALVGRKAGGQDCYLDIHEKYHGPHGLVAGTTGSGKSETLQTYILSLAVNYSPNDVSFFIIDYKGGGMANLFSGLPHLAGQISNLSGNQVHRAMISIKSENLRRQRVFAQNGVNHINAYTRLFKEHRTDLAIPHLFIIIDEFAELKREEPDFMRELISVAQVGRSLGVHLLLATQKPSGTVDDNIRANAKFSLCLRVQDRQDSLEMLHRPDAAYLTQAGRCYLQVGNDEIFELFQSGYSGAIFTGDAHKGSVAAMIGRTGKTELLSGPAGETELGTDSRTEMDAVIEYLRQVSVSEGYGTTSQLWLPVLSDHIILDQLKRKELAPSAGKGAPVLCATVGLYDDPANQAQKSLYIDFMEGGHLAVCGNVVSGKSTFLQTLCWSLMTAYTPEELQLYILDFSGQMLMPFAKAPHVGGVVAENQPDRLSKFFVLIRSILDERKKILKGGNFSQYRRVSGEALPSIVMVIDNYSSFREKSNDKYDSDISRIVREGAGCGVWLAVSASGFGMADIPSRIGDYMGNTVTLEQQDKFKYLDVLRQPRLGILPETGIKGRGLAIVDDRVLEFQTALCIEANDDFSRGQILEGMSEKMAGSWKGMLPAEIPEIPENPTMDIMAVNQTYISATQSPHLFPVGYDAVNASVYSMDLRKNYCFVIAGRVRSGKTTTLRSLIYTAAKKGYTGVVIERKKADYSSLEQHAKSAGFSYAGTNKEIFDWMGQKLIPVFAERNKKKQEMLKSGMDEEEIATAMLTEKPVCVFIDDFGELLHMAYKPEEGVGSMGGFLENIFAKGRSHGIFFFAGVKVDDEPTLTVHRAYNLFVSAKKGMHLGGNLMSQRLFQFQNIPMGEQSKVKRKGSAYISDDEDEASAHELIVPALTTPSAKGGA